MYPKQDLSSPRDPSNPPRLLSFPPPHPRQHLPLSEAPGMYLTPCFLAQIETFAPGRRGDRSKNVGFWFRRPLWGGAAPTPSRRPGRSLLLQTGEGRTQKLSRRTDARPGRSQIPPYLLTRTLRALQLPLLLTSYVRSGCILFFNPVLPLHPAPLAAQLKWPFATNWVSSEV